MCQKLSTSQFKALDSNKEVLVVKSKMNVYDRDDIFSAKNSTVDLNVWTKTETKMIAAVVTFIEFSLLFLALSRALFSIVKPQVQHGVYSLFVLLPLSLLPFLFGQVDAKEDRLDD